MRPNKAIMSLLIVGTMAFDSIETPFGKVEMVIGGACTYASWSASYFTNTINMVSIVGGDFPDDEMKRLNARGASSDGVEIVKDKKSFFWAGKYHDNMNSRDTLVTDLNVLADFDPVLPGTYKNSDLVLLGNLTPEVQIKVMDQMESKPKLIALDTMNFWMDIAMDSLLKAIARVDILTINDDEARQLSGEYSLVNAASKILTMGPKALIIKKGEHGALLFYKDKMFYAPALPLAQVKDPTGAGDTFAGGFMGYLDKTGEISFESLKRAIIYGSTMASFCVEEFSLDRIQSLNEEEISTRVSQFRELTAFDL